MFIRCRNGDTFQIEPGTDIQFIEYKLGDIRIRFISGFSGRTIDIPVSEVARIF